MIAIEFQVFSIEKLRRNLGISTEFNWYQFTLKWFSFQSKNKSKGAKGVDSLGETLLIFWGRHVLMTGTLWELLKAMVFKLLLIKNWSFFYKICISQEFGSNQDWETEPATAKSVKVVSTSCMKADIIPVAVSLNSSVLELPWMSGVCVKCRGSPRLADDTWCAVCSAWGGDGAWALQPLICGVAGDWQQLGPERG